MNIVQHLDIPKENIKDDKLNFAPFANRIAKGILNYTQQETLIFSIEGQWGSGKTTLINFIKRDIEDETIILHFNPWLIVDIEVLVEQFLEELLKTIINNSWKVKALEEVLPELKKTFKSYARMIVKVIPDINVEGNIGFLKIDSKVKLSSLADRFEENKEELTLHELKEKINGYLDKLGNKKIVIIVDDIDRLTDKETEFIFRLTKGIADFNNLIYILLYDKTIVSKSLQTFKQEDGEKYLEKIVQYSLSVPKPHNIT
ncbi:MAG: AAA family ATPase, partial [Flavobacteriaceae bacterium]|nr:AAA family ATPase [Flavobacteriaceae bacterium]